MRVPHRLRPRQRSVRTFIDGAEPSCRRGRSGGMHCRDGAVGRRPVSSQRLVRLVGEEFLGNLASPSRSPKALSSARLAAYLSIIFFLFRSRAIIDFLAITYSPY